jgi:serine/threonine-protein kinase
LNPRYASAHQWFSFLLAARGQFDAALLEAHTAVELDPASVSGRRTLGWVYYYARRYDQAREHLARAIEMNPMAVESYRMLGTTMALLGQPAEAERVLREARTLPDSGTYMTATLGWLLARSGKREEAEALLRAIEAERQKGYVSPVAFAILYIGLGNLQHAIDWSERAYEERRGWIVYANVNAIFDPLRTEPRFKALVSEMGL